MGVLLHERSHTMLRDQMDNTIEKAWKGQGEWEDRKMGEAWMGEKDGMDEEGRDQRKRQREREEKERRRDENRMTVGLHRVPCVYCSYVYNSPVFYSSFLLPLLCVSLCVFPCLTLWESRCRVRVGPSGTERRRRCVVLSAQLW